LFADLGLDVVIRPVVVQQSVDVVEFAVDELARGRTQVVLVKRRDVAVEFGVCEFTVGAGEERPWPLGGAVGDQSVLISGELSAVCSCEFVRLALGEAYASVSVRSEMVCLLATYP
jgi:hypothetical protein